MRLLYDLFPCQTGSRLRGIGRYALSLASAMAARRGSHDMIALANAWYPDSVDCLRQELGRALPPGHVATYTYPRRNRAGTAETAATAVAAGVIRRAWQDLMPDVVLYANPFEGWAEEGIVAFPQDALPAALRVAVLYDFIPMLFPEQYLNGVPAYKAWYEERVRRLHDFDLLLAISEATRQDAIRILGIAPDRVVNIGGAANAIFCKPPAGAESAGNVAVRFGIERPFVLYTGNADYRKNQDGMLRAYANLPRSLRARHQLVLNQVGDKDAFRHKARQLGLEENEVVITGHVSDAELIALYSSCKTFVFPSLYEGFGLPILEAMACGAPVIAADNSSIPEITGRRDVLFDAGDPRAIASMLERVLSDDAWREELAAYGRERSQAFCWDKTAAVAWEAIEARLAAAPRPAAQTQTGRERVAMVCPAMSADSAVGRHCLDIRRALQPRFDIDVFVEAGTAEAGGDGAPHPHTALAARRSAYAAVVYQLADDARCAYMLPLIEQIPGIVVLHDSHADAVLKAFGEQAGLHDAREQEILYTEGLQGLLPRLRQPERAAPLALARHVVEFADYLLLAVPAGIEPGRAARHGAWLPPIASLTEGDAAERYAAAIGTVAAGDMRHTIRQLADACKGQAADDARLDAIASHIAGNRRLRKHARLLIDVTQLAKTDARSGIQRVVRNIARELCEPGMADLPIELVRLADGRLVRAVSVAESIHGLAAGTVPEQELIIHPGDVLLMIDSSWEQYPAFLPVFEEVRQCGGSIVTVVYDLIPLRMPQTCHPGLVGVFRHWFGLAVQESDMLVCISKAVADDVRAYLDEHALWPARALAVRHWPLGADLLVHASEEHVREQVRELVADDTSPLLLMVGTVEPRKGHDDVLDAFDALWQRKADVRLCIAGSVGWMVDKTVQRIATHPQLNRKLFFVEKFTDAEINLCYAHATALIAASKAEGFGLPIVEAALHQVPVVASDIPVFREVGGEGALFFRVGDSADLAEKVLQMVALDESERVAMSRRIPVVNWTQSAQRLWQIVGRQVPEHAA